MWETSKCNTSLPKVWWALPSPIPGTSHLGRGCCTTLHLSAHSDRDPTGPCLPPTHRTGGQARAPLQGHSHLGHLISHELTSEVGMGWTHSAPASDSNPRDGRVNCLHVATVVSTACAPCASPQPELQHAGVIWQLFRPGRFLMSHCSAQCGGSKAGASYSSPAPPSVGTMWAPLLKTATVNMRPLVILLSRWSVPSEPLSPPVHKRSPNRISVTNG